MMVPIQFWRNNRSFYKRFAAFTLIELLVVIAIISLLVSILLPSLNTAKDLARKVVCSSALHSLMLSMSFYEEDFDSVLVPICTQVVGSDGTYYSTWRGLLREYTDSSKTEMSLFRCPTDTSPHTEPNSPIYARPKSFGINFQLIDLHGYRGPSNSEMVGGGGTRADILRPSETICMGDLGYPGNGGYTSAPPEEWTRDVGGYSMGYMRMPNDSCFFTGDTWDIYPRHLQLANVAFYDSHVEAVNVSEQLFPYEPGDGSCIYDNQ